MARSELQAKGVFAAMPRRLQAQGRATQSLELFELFGPLKLPLHDLSPVAIISTLPRIRTLEYPGNETEFMARRPHALFSSPRSRMISLGL